MIVLNPQGGRLSGTYRHAGIRLHYQVHHLWDGSVDIFQRHETMKQNWFMRIGVDLRLGVEIKDLGVLQFGMRADEMLELLGEPNSVYSNRYEFRKLGFFVDVQESETGGLGVVDAIEFWNDGPANVASVMLQDFDVLREPASVGKALLESLNSAPPIDGWYVNLDVFVSGGNPIHAQQAIDQAIVDGTFEETKEALLAELQRATLFTSFGIGRRNYCRDGLAELAAIGRSI